MQHPYIANSNANLRLNQMIQDAENYRQIKRISNRSAGSNFLSELKERFPALKSQRLDKSANSPA
jgi:hypothetical protein